MSAFADLPKGHFGAIYADPPWHFKTWDGRKFSGGNQVRADGSRIAGGARGTPYDTMPIEASREHSRKPDCVPGRIERLVAGPYLELFARTQRPGWTVWGNQTDKFASEAA